MATPLSRDAWLLAICAGRMIFYSVFMVAAACLPVLRAEWGMTATEAGTVMAGFSFGYALSLLVFSWLADHVGAKRVFLASAALSALSALAFGFFARSYASALVLYSLAALTQGGLYTPAIMLIADRYEPGRRGAAVGWLIASNSVGYAFSVVMAGAMLEAGGYELAFTAAGLLPLPGVLVCWLTLRTTANLVRRRGRGAGPWRGAPAQRQRPPPGRRLHLPLLGAAWLVGLVAGVPGRRPSASRGRR